MSSYSATMPRIIPYLSIPSAREAIEWYKRVFGAEVQFIADAVEGKEEEGIMHSSVKIGDGVFMIADRYDFNKETHKLTLDKSEPTEEDVTRFNPVTVNVSFPTQEEVSAVWARALEGEKNAKVTMALEQQFWGDFWGSFRDPYGVNWAVYAVVKEPSKEDLDEGRKYFQP